MASRSTYCCNSRRHRLWVQVPESSRLSVWDNQGPWVVSSHWTWAGKSSVRPPFEKHLMVKSSAFPDTNHKTHPVSLQRPLFAPIRKPRTKLTHWLIPSPYRSDPKGPDFWSGTFPSPHNASARAWSGFRKPDGPIPCRWGPCRIHCPSKMVSSFVSLGPVVMKRNLESHTPWMDCVNTVSRPSVPLLPSVLLAVTHDVTFYWKCHLKPESRSAGNRTRMTLASPDLCPLHSPPRKVEAPREFTQKDYLPNTPFPASFRNVRSHITSH